MAGRLRNFRTPLGSAALPGIIIGQAKTGLFYSGGLHFSISGVDIGSMTGATFAWTIPGGGTSNFTVSGESTTQGSFRRFSDDANASLCSTFKARGSIAAPTVPNNLDRLGEFAYFAYTVTGATSGFTQSASIRCQFVETGTPTPTAVGSQLRFMVCPIGSGTLTEVARMDTASGLSMFGANIAIDAARGFRRRIYTFATLPSANPSGQYVQISDGAAVPVFSAAAAGAGTLATPVYSDGTTWRNG
jgi:hypothetical protein